MRSTRVWWGTAIATLAVGVIVGLALLTPALASGGGFDPRNVKFTGDYEGQVGSGSEHVQFTVGKHNGVKYVQFDLITGSQSRCHISFYIQRRDQIDKNGEFTIYGRRAHITGTFVHRKRVRGQVFADHWPACSAVHAPYFAHRVASGY
jgi:hypothetical protein